MNKTDEKKKYKQKKLIAVAKKSQSSIQDTNKT